MFVCRKMKLFYDFMITFKKNVKKFYFEKQPFEMHINDLMRNVSG